MRIFKINKNIDVVCQYIKTRYGFKHTASLIYKGSHVCDTKICYYNRTWEAYEYQSVLQSIIHKTNILNDKQKAVILNKLKIYG